MLVSALAWPTATTTRWRSATPAAVARLQCLLDSSRFAFAAKRSATAAAASCLVVLLSFGADLGPAHALDRRYSSISSAECDYLSSAEAVKPDDEQDVTNESLVEAAWEIVNNVFLDARRHTWSPGAWLAEKEKVLKGSLKNRAAAYSAIRSMLATLGDPFTRFLTPTEFARMSKYDITGIGLNIGELPDEAGHVRVRVLGVILDSAAQFAGIQEGDEIVSVDGNPVTGKTAFQVASAVQGRKGTPVTIEVRRAGCANTQKYVVNRDREREIQSPVLYRLERSDDPTQRRGYIRLKEFNALTRPDLVIAMQRLRDAGATSFVLDLRDNLGGLVQEGIEVAKLFLEDGDTVVYTARRDPGSSKKIVATGEPLVRAPLIVLVNNRTASASEIVAAALHDNCRAVLVGGRTFGKGLIQSVYELNDGSGVVLTVGKYVSPKYVDIDGNGLQPDFKKAPGLLELDRKLRACRAGHSQQAG